MASLDQIEKLQRTDHDTIVRMEAKLDNIGSDVKTMGDGLARSIGEHEARLRSIESDIVSVGGIKPAWERFLKIESYIHDTRLTQNIYRAIAGLVGGAIFWVLTQAPAVLREWGIMK